jgi:hypothetical protein
MKAFDVGAIINVIYKAEVDLCIQNHPETGFYGTVCHNQIFYRGLKLQDFMQVKEEVYQISGSSVLEMNRWYLSNSLKDLCNFFFKEVSREIPQIFEYMESEESTNLEDILINAHLQGCQFIIESTLDCGYDVFLLNKNCHIRELKTFNSYEANEIAKWLDVEINSYSHNYPFGAGQYEQRNS